MDVEGPISGAGAPPPRAHDLGSRSLVTETH
jgi:hypothetical protein